MCVWGVGGLMWLLDCDCFAFPDLLPLPGSKTKHALLSAVPSARLFAAQARHAGNMHQSLCLSAHPAPVLPLGTCSPPPLGYTQPNSDIVDTFDDLMLLAAGYVAYSGTWKEAVPYFNARGFSCPMYKNPTDYFMSLACDGQLVPKLAALHAGDWHCMNGHQ